MKQHEVKQERTLNGNTFYVRPFSALTSANISGELATLVTPVLTSLAPIFAGATDKENDSSLLNIDATEAAPHLATAMSGLSGDKVETLLKKLLIQHKNISVELEGEKGAQLFTEDIANEVFCGEAQDMFILAFDVIKANYSGFFKRLGGRFGEGINALLERT